MSIVLQAWHNPHPVSAVQRDVCFSAMWPVHSYTARGQYTIHVDSRGRRNTRHNPPLPNQAGEEQTIWNICFQLNTYMFTAALPRGHALPMLCTAVVADRNLTRPTWPAGVAQATRLGKVALGLKL